jgi:uncharacterized coiled-coil DUF342 family protein
MVEEVVDVSSPCRRWWETTCSEQERLLLVDITQCLRAAERYRKKMSQYFDKLDDVQQRIAETEQRIVELKLTPAPEATLLIETASAVLSQLRAYKGRLHAKMGEAFAARGARAL